MSTMLDNIWDEPLANEPSPPRDTTAAADPADDSGDDMLRPSKRRRSSLFLDDPDEIEEQANSPSEGATAGGGAGSARPEIDAMFDEVEEMDGASSRPFDIEAYRREAQRRAEKEVVVPSSSYPQHAVRSSSPPPAGADGDKDGDDEDEPGKKGRRKIAKIDENRLLGKDGFPALVKQVKSFKPRGKGNEQADLNKLINMYQFWSHKMMPKWTFSDTVNRVEKVCRSKRMTVAVSAWKDEFNGTIHGNKFGDGDDDSQSESGDEKNKSNDRE
ncbi:Swi3-domain-containing protein, partial [Schizopora paradoxa]